MRCGKLGDVPGRANFAAGAQQHGHKFSAANANAMFLLLHILLLPEAAPLLS
jgi:hypothetical protein